MNMPLTKDGMVDFNATLFGLIRSSLNIKRPEGTVQTLQNKIFRNLCYVSGVICKGTML